MKKGGFPGGMGIPGGMNNLMKQAQRMQRQMEEQQKALEEQRKELEAKTFTGKAGGGAVVVEMTGKREITKVHIDPDACDPEDTETLEEMVTAAFGDALKQIDAENNSLSESAAGAMGGLGGLGGFGL